VGRCGAIAPPWGRCEISSCDVSRYGAQSLLLLPGGRNKKTTNQIGIITIEPSNTFGQAQAKPCFAYSSIRSAERPNSCISLSTVIPKWAMMVPTTNEATATLTRVRKRGFSIRSPSRRPAGE